MLSTAVVRWLLSRSEWLVLAVDVERVAALASLGPVALYTGLAGLGVATLRSTIMVVVAVLAGLAGRRVDVLRSLAVAAVVLALAWPGAPLEISFQLSFVSVLAIVLGARRFGPQAPGGGWRARLRAAALVSPSALAGTAPLTAFHFHQVSVVGLVANPIAVPIFGSLVVVVGLAGALVEPFAPAAARALFQLAGLVLRPGIAVVRWLAAPGWAAVDVPIPSVVELALCYGALAGLLLTPGRVGRLLAAIALAGLVADAGWWVHERFDDRLRATFLDVGQGDAAVLELPAGRVVVVDAGGFPGGEFDTGAAVVAPFLLTRKVLRLDAVAMTHAHPDHFGGIGYLLAHFHPREFWWSGVPGSGVEWERLAAAVQASGARIRRLDSATAVADSVTVLHPPPELGKTSINDSSLALRVARGRFGGPRRAAPPRPSRSPAEHGLEGAASREPDLEHPGVRLRRRAPAGRHVGRRRQPVSTAGARGRAPLWVAWDVCAPHRPLRRRHRRDRRESPGGARRTPRLRMPRQHAGSLGRERQSAAEPQEPPQEREAGRGFAEPGMGSGARGGRRAGVGPQGAQRPSTARAPRGFKPLASTRGAART